MEQIKSAKLNKTLTSQDVTTHLKVLRSSGGAIQSFVAVPWKRGARTEFRDSAGDRRVFPIMSRVPALCVSLWAPADRS